MFHFLEQLYFSTKSDDLGSFLGSMSFLTSGKTADPAMWNRWNKSVEYALNGARRPMLQLGKK